MNQIIKIVQGAPAIIEDPWTLGVSDSAGPSLLPLTDWLQVITDATDAPSAQRRAPWISVEDDFEEHIERLLGSELIAVDFPSFRDGRGYSTANLLRSRYGYQGELRAIGDVLRDQLKHMRRCGFDAFMIRADKSIEDALMGLRDFSVHYQRSVTEPLPLFRRRSASNA